MLGLLRLAILMSTIKVGKKIGYSITSPRKFLYHQHSFIIVDLTLIIRNQFSGENFLPFYSTPE